jgi:purine-cytosine permease-like protein
MANELLPDDVRNVWQSQKAEDLQLSLEEIRKKARKFHGQIGRRNLREYIAVVVVVLGYGFYVFHYHDFLMRLGSILTITGALYVAYQLHRKGSAKTLPEDCGFECCVDFHRRELERQRDALRSVWWWYLGPLVPGLAVFTIGQELAKPPRHPQHHWIGFAVYVAILVLIFVGVWWLNQMAVRFLQKQIDELNGIRTR